MTSPLPANAPPPRRLALDTRALQADASLRLIAGAIALCAALWLFLVSSDWLLRAFGVAAVLFAGLWAARFRRTQTRLQTAEDNYLELTGAGVVLVDRGEHRAVPWADTTGIAIDEDRLQVLILLAEGDPVRIEPQYESLALRKLAEIIYEYRRDWSTCIAAGDD